MQGIYYVGFCTFLILFDFLFQRNVTLNQIFSFKEIEFTVRGSVVIASLLLNSLLCALGLMIVVERAKKVLDFSVTMYFCHAVCTALWDGIPVSWEWWTVVLFCLVVQTLLAEYLTFKYVELKEIPLQPQPHIVQI
jgi:hypothetical protein